MPTISGIPGLRDGCGGISKTPKKKFHTIASSTPSRTPSRSRDAPTRGVDQPLTPARGMQLFNGAAASEPDGQGPDTSSNIKVFVRVRPNNQRDSSADNVVSIPTTDTVFLSSSEQKPFTFDYVADDTTTQQEMFDMIGVPFTDSFIGGYNGCIFAYGQTGSGKTYTMQGPDMNTSSASDQAGLIPRVLDYLFEQTARNQDAANILQDGSLQYSCRCAFLEIYNERVTDLLDTSKSNLDVRENQRDGIFVDQLTWQNVASATETCAVLLKGVRNRHVGETAMNKESSRSHSVFTIKIESVQTSSNGLIKKRHSCLNLVDLAGSERQKSTNTTGERLKEATQINKSLSALGSVILALSDISRGHARHVHYRDSKLTFLLKDSLGGNSKTAIIANISPSGSSFGETLSTLKFAQRAKLIKTRAIVNEDVNGNLDQMKIEIKRLKQELALAKNISAPLPCSPGTTTTHSRPSTSSTASSEQSPTSAETKELQGRLRDLENLLFKCLETQTNAECENSGMQELCLKAQTLVEAKEAQDNQLFQSLKMQLKLKTESLKHLLKQNKKHNPARLSKGVSGLSEDGSVTGSAEGEEGEDASEEDGIINLLRAENDELRKEQEISWAHNPEMAKIVKDNLRLQQELKDFKGADVESRKVIDNINRELRDQYMHVCKDKRKLEVQLDAALNSASSGGAQGGENSTPSRKLASMTSPERHAYESLQLQQWREEQAFEDKMANIKAERDAAIREAQALEERMAAMKRQAQVAEADKDEFEQKLSGSELDFSDIKAKLRSKAENKASSAEGLSASLESAQQEIQKLQTQVEEMKEESAAKAHRVGQLESMLHAAEYAVSLMDKGHNKRASTSNIDAAKVALMQDEIESLQLKLQQVQDEFDDAKEEFAYRETRIEKLDAQVRELEGSMLDQKVVIEQASLVAASRESKIAELESALRDNSKGSEEHLARQANALRECEAKIQEHEQSLAESRKVQAELQDSLAQQQSVHEALQKETSTCHEVLRDTHLQLETKTSALEHAHADLSMQASEIKELKEHLDSELAENDKLRTSLVETKKRHEALIDDREGLEELHRKQLDEMMAELNVKKDKIKALEKEMASCKEQRDQASQRLSDVHGAAVEARQIKDQMLENMKTMETQNNELFETKFELQGAQSQLKLLTSQNEELEVQLEEACHAGLEQTRLIQRLEEETESSKAVRAEVKSITEKLAAKQKECDTLSESVKKLEAAAAEASSKIEGLQKEMEANVAAVVASESILLQFNAKSEETAQLRLQMAEWLEEMKCLKENEMFYKAESTTHREAMEGLIVQLEALKGELKIEQDKNEELNKINTKLIGHSNPKQKVQHTVKIKEENNTLKAQLSKELHELSKTKDKVDRLEAEVNKLRAALGVEGGAAQILAEEKEVREQVEAKEKEVAEMREHVESVALAVRALLAGRTALGNEHPGNVLEAVKALKEHLNTKEKLLDEKQGEMEKSDFALKLLTKELHLAKSAVESENKHPNSPSMLKAKAALASSPRKVPFAPSM